MGKERRKHTRVVAPVPFLMIDKQGKERTFDLVDLSESGARIKCPLAIAPMTRVKVAMVLPGDRVGHEKDVRVDTTGVVVWSHKADDARYDTGVFFPELDEEKRSLLQTYVLTAE